MSNGVRPSFDRTLTFGASSQQQLHFGCITGAPHERRGAQFVGGVGIGPGCQQKTQHAGVPSAAAYMSWPYFPLTRRGRLLKPSNVLVAEQDGTPVPKVIDFGIAKASDKWAVENTLPPTSARSSADVRWR